MTLTWQEACARVGAPGSPFEIVEDDRGNRRFKHAPPNLRSLFDIARQGGDEIFIVFEDERWSFSSVFERVDALADLWSADTASVRATGSRSACATTPSG
jgi:hypothetical protein